MTWNVTGVGQYATSIHHQPYLSFTATYAICTLGTFFTRSCIFGNCSVRQISITVATTAEPNKLHPVGPVERGRADDWVHGVSHVWIV